MNEDGVTFITMGDLDPPQSTISDLPPRQFGIGVGEPASSLDLLSLSYGPGLDKVQVRGEFLPVPEPRLNEGYLLLFSLFGVRWFGKRMAP